MAIDWGNIFGNLGSSDQATEPTGWSGMLSGVTGSLANSLGYGNMPVQAKRKNAPPTQELLPSQQAGHEMMHGVHAGMSSMDDKPSMTAPDLQNLLSFHANGGRLDKSKINIVGEDGPEAVVDGKVTPIPRSLAPIADELGNSVPVEPANAPPVKSLLPNDGDGNDSEGAGDDDSHTQDQRPLEAPVQTGQAVDPNSVDALTAQVQQTLAGRTKRSPWADLGVGLVQAGDNWFNHKNEPIKTLAEMRADKQLSSLMPRYKIAQDAANTKREAEYQRARERDMAVNRNIQQAVLDDRTQGRKDEITEKQHGRDATAQNLKMRLVQRQWDNLKGGYDPSNPKFAELTKALGDVNLPVTPKDAKKNVKFEQDAETGAWNVTLVDPSTGEQETRPVTTKDGAQLTTTSPSRVTADAASGRQTSQQQFTAGENEKNRAQRRDEFMRNYQQKVTSDLMQFAGNAQKKAQWLQSEIRRIESDKDIPEDVRQQMLDALGNQP